MFKLLHAWLPGHRDTICCVNTIPTSHEACDLETRKSTRVISSQWCPSQPSQVPPSHLSVKWQCEPTSYPSLTLHLLSSIQHQACWTQGKCAVTVQWSLSLKTETESAPPENQSCVTVQCKHLPTQVSILRSNNGKLHGSPQITWHS